MFDLATDTSHDQVQHLADEIAHATQFLAGSRVAVCMASSVNALAAYIALTQHCQTLACPPNIPNEHNFLSQCCAVVRDHGPGVELVPDVWLVLLNNNNSINNAGMTFFSSGTTNAPREIFISNSVLKDYISVDYQIGLAPTKDETMYFGLPIHHGWGFSTIWIAWNAGRQIYIKPWTNGREQIIRADAIADYIVAPKALMKVQKFKQLTNTKRICICGVGIPHEDKLVMADKLGVPIMDEYGQTEINGVSMQDYTNWQNPGVGIPYCDNKIEDGMLWLKPTWLGEWVNTKDLAEYGHDEQVIIKGRADLSLVTDRGRFLSEDIESALRTQLGVDQCLLVPNRTINKFDCYYQGSATETDVVDYIKTICGSTHIINQIKQADIKEDFLGKVSLK